MAVANATELDRWEMSDSPTKTPEDEEACAEFMILG